MRTEPGKAEYRALTDALDEIRPACHDDWRFIQERQEIDDDDLAQMRRLCRTCPLAAVCSAYAEKARPAAGMWAGRYWGRKERS